MVQLGIARPTLACFVRACPALLRTYAVPPGGAMSARRCSVIAAVGFVTASASASAQMWSSPNTYCPIGASFCLEEYFSFSLTSARYERMFGIFPKFMGGAYLRSGEAIE